MKSELKKQSERVIKAVSEYLSQRIFDSGRHLFTDFG